MALDEDEALALIQSAAWKRYVWKILMPRVLEGHRRLEAKGEDFERISGALAELRLLIHHPYLQAKRPDESPYLIMEAPGLPWLREAMGQPNAEPEFTEAELQELRERKAARAATPPASERPRMERRSAPI